MTAQRWQLVESLFERAFELPGPARASFLADHCEDPELRAEVQELLATARDPGGSLRDAVIAEAQALASAATTAQVGRRIGPFRLLALLGEGGMGAVYLAERDDAQFHHRVAIKILPHSLGAPHAVARFRDERQILAALEHPNIVRLLDGGSTDDGLPYLVMEHIEGTTITRFARDHQLSVRARLALARQVCAGLQYAHQNLIVHRDVKPSNILVDADGTPKILDFGIAKLLATDAGFAREARTRTGSAMFTPEYASPEQARGDAVSTATDVYSLGAVLYELVTGQPPHATTASALDSLRLICEVDPPRPSAAAPPDRHRELTGDLDNIILKALHKEPARRYASVEQLSDDLGRFLDGLPVAARTATVGYRAQKFVRRNKVAVAAATLVIATLSAATLVSLRQARRADDQAARAEVEKANALDAARRAQIETDHARRAEAQVKAQLEQIKAEQSARARAEADARAKGNEVELSREQLQVALTRAQEEKRLAEQESARAREAETRAEGATRAETAARKEAEALVQKERARVRQLEEQSKKITNELR